MSLEEIPPEILEQVAEGMNPDSLLQFLRSSDSIRQRLGSPFFWKKFVASGVYDPPSEALFADGIVGENYREAYVDLLKERSNIWRFNDPTAVTKAAADGLVIPTHYQLRSKDTELAIPPEVLHPRFLAAAENDSDTFDNVQIPVQITVDFGLSSILHGNYFTVFVCTHVNIGLNLITVFDTCVGSEPSVVVNAPLPNFEESLMPGLFCLWRDHWLIINTTTLIDDDEDQELVRFVSVRDLTNARTSVRIPWRGDEVNASESMTNAISVVEKDGDARLVVRDLREFGWVVYIVRLPDRGVERKLNLSLPGSPSWFSTLFPTNFYFWGGHERSSAVVPLFHRFLVRSQPKFFFTVSQTGLAAKLVGCPKYLTLFGGDAMDVTQHGDIVVLATRNRIRCLVICRQDLEQQFQFEEEVLTLTAEPWENLFMLPVQDAVDRAIVRCCQAKNVVVALVRNASGGDWVYGIDYSAAAAPAAGGNLAFSIRLDRPSEPRAFNLGLASAPATFVVLADSKESDRRVLHHYDAHGGRLLLTHKLPPANHSWPETADHRCCCGVISAHCLRVTKTAIYVHYTARVAPEEFDVIKW